MGVVVRKRISLDTGFEKRMRTSDEVEDLRIARRRRNGYFYAIKMISVHMSELISSITEDEVDLLKLLKVMNFTEDFGQFPEDLAALDEELRRIAIVKLRKNGFRPKRVGSKFWVRDGNKTKWLTWI